MQVPTAVSLFKRRESSGGFRKAEKGDGLGAPHPEGVRPGDVEEAEMKRRHGPTCPLVPGGDVLEWGRVGLGPRSGLLP